MSYLIDEFRSDAHLFLRGHEIPAKTSICVLWWTLYEEFQKFVLKGVILPQNRHFWVVLVALHVTDLQVTGYIFWLT